MFQFLRRTMALVCLAVPVLSAQVPPKADRVAAYPELTPAVRLAGHVPRWATPAADTGSVPASTPLHLTFVLSRSAEQQADFTQLLADQQDPASPRFHQWLTPADVGRLYGPTQHDLDALTTWLATQGLPDAQVSPGGLLVNIHASAAAVASALSTSIHTFQLPDGPRFAATEDPALPAGLAPLVQSIQGLSEPSEQPSIHELPPVSASSVQPRSADPRYTYASSYHYLTPDDFATIFDLKPSFTAGLLGTGQRIAVIGRSRVASADITGLESLVGHGDNLPNVVLPDPASDPGYAANGDQAEATLDVSRVLGTAPLAQVDLVITSSAGGGISTAAQYAVNTLNDSVMNISFGSCEATQGLSSVRFWDTLFSQAAAQGISVFVASGDSGAAGCDPSGTAAPYIQNASISDICASSYATCVGGTELIDTPSSAFWSASNNSRDGSALGYIPEGAWNDPVSTSSSGSYVVLATGGGASTFISKPAWQTGSGVPADGKRDVPDVSFPSSGHNGYYTCYATDGGDCSNGSFALFFGTSAASPSMAAIASLVNQRTGTRQGNFNPLLYSLAANPANNVFHDATVASSAVPGCSAAIPSTCNNSTPGPQTLAGGLPGFLLAPGFDLATGWGSLDVGNLLAAITPSMQAPTSVALTISPASPLVSATVTFTANITSTAQGSPGGFVQLFNNGNPWGNPLPVTAGDASYTTSFNSDTTGQFTAFYSGDSNFAPSTTAFTQYLNVHRLYSSLFISPSPLTYSVLSPEGFTVTVGTTPGNPVPTGTIQVQQLSPFSNLGTFPLVNGIAVVPTLPLNPGSSTLQVSYGGDANYESASTYIPVTVNGLASNFTLTPGTTTISPPQNATFTATLAVPSGTPTGTMQLYIDYSPATPAVPLSGFGPITLTASKVSLGTHSVYASYSGDSLFNPKTSNTVTLNNSGFYINPANYGYNFAAGATNTITVTYQSVAGFSGTITQSCTITTPSGANQLDYAPACSFSPATLTLGANASATSTLTITSVVPRAVQTRQLTRNVPSRPARSPRAPAAMLAGVFLLCIGPKMRRAHLRRLAIFAAFAVLALNGLTSCSSGGGSSTSTSTSLTTTTPVGPGFYSFVLTGTSGPVVETSSAINTMIQ